MDDKKERVHIEFVNIIDDNGELVNYHFYVNYSDISARIRIKRGGKIEPPPKGFKRARIDKPSQGRKHIHIYKNDEYVSINDDGTKHHDKGKPITIPKKLYRWIKENFPDFNLPDNRIVQFNPMYKPMYEHTIIINIDNNYYSED